MQIMILGMHRSGTSVVARLLNMMGAYFGPEGSMTMPNIENPKGFWERRDVRALNDALIHAQGKEWNRMLGFDTGRTPESVLVAQKKVGSRLILDLDAHRPWVLKEPRFCFTLPFWKPLLETPVFVHVVRDPIQVALSLRTRNSVPLPVGVALWEAYVLAQFGNASGAPSVHVQHGAILSDPVREARRLFEELSALNVRRLEMPSDQEILRFVDAGLFRSRDTSEERVLLPAQRRVWEACQEGRFESLTKMTLSRESNEVLTEYEPIALRLEEAERARHELQRQGGKLTELETRIGEDATRHRQAMAEVAAGLRDVAKVSKEIGTTGAECRELRARLETQEALARRTNDLLGMVPQDVLSKLGRPIEHLAKLMEAMEQRLNSKLGQIDATERDREGLLGQLADLIQSSLGEESILFEGINRSTEATVAQMASQVLHRLAVIETSLRESSGQVEGLRLAHDAEVRLRERLATILLTRMTASREERLQMMALAEKCDGQSQRLRKALEKATELANAYRSTISYRVIHLLGFPMRLIGKQGDALEHLVEHGRREVNAVPRERPMQHAIESIWSTTAVQLSESQEAEVLAGLKAASRDSTSAARTLAWRAPHEPVYREVCELGIVILSLNGASLLDSLFQSFHAHRPNCSFVIAVTDHGSTDGTREVIRKWSDTLPIRVNYATKNYSFSFSNNCWAEQLHGCDYLLFLNNDIVFHENVIDPMVRCLVDPTVGIVGIDQMESADPGKPASWHHCGIGFTWDDDYTFWRPFNIKQKDPRGDWPVREVAAVTGSVMLVRRCDFLAVGGFDENYCYGYEDVDLCLALQQRLGKRAVCVVSDGVEHADGATRGKMPKDEVRPQRLANIERLRQRFSSTVNRMQRAAMAEGRSLSGAPLRVAFAVTDVGESTVAGDLFTAMELGSAMQSEFGWAVEYRARGEDWYCLQGVDVVVAMVDAFDPRQIKRAHPALLRIAWARNWFERWCSREGSDGFDLILASSALSADYIEQRIGQPSRVLRIGANTTRFSPEHRQATPELDYVFTGSYWNAPRDIVAAISALPDQFKGAVFGEGWADVPEIAHLDRGFRPYAELPSVYRNAKILLDDANHVTKPWGSVNSRVFDGLAAGCLVITNAERASQDGFDGELPVYRSPEHLRELVAYFVEHPAERQELQDRLRDRVMQSHSYQRRAHEFVSHLRGQIAGLRRIAIKLPVPKRELASEWGDFHFAECLAKQLRHLGHRVRLDFLAEWSRGKDEGDDIVLVLRGLSEYQPRPETVNLLWLMSHPDKVTAGELERFDHVFVASQSHALKLAGELAVPVSCLLQCTDPDRFHPFPSDKHVSEGADVLFVGNSRNVMRRIVRDAIEAGITPTIYGTRWEKLVDPSLIRGQNIPNEQLGVHYAGAAVVLNDHWPDMAAKGFLSNRLFDAVASGARVVSDYCAGMEHIFGDAIVTYGTSADLPEAIREAASPDRREAVQKIQREVLDKHTFSARAEVIMARAEAILTLKVGLPEHSAGVSKSTEIDNTARELNHQSMTR